jgi:Ca2+/Na+ antiporter
MSGIVDLKNLGESNSDDEDATISGEDQPTDAKAKASRKKESKQHKCARISCTVLKYAIVWFLVLAYFIQFVSLRQQYEAIVSDPCVKKCFSETYAFNKTQYGLTLAANATLLDEEISVIMSHAKNEALNYTKEMKIKLVLGSKAEEANHRATLDDSSYSGVLVFNVMLCIFIALPAGLWTYVSINREILGIRNSEEYSEHQQ